MLALRRDIPFQKAALADRIKGFLGSAHSDHPEGKAEKRHEFFQDVHLAYGDYFEPTSGAFPEIKTPSHYSFDSKNPDPELYFSGRTSQGPLPPYPYSSYDRYNETHYQRAQGAGRVFSKPESSPARSPPQSRDDGASEVQDAIAKGHMQASSAMEIKVAMPDNCKMPRVLQRIQETGTNLLVILGFLEPPLQCGRVRVRWHCVSYHGQRFPTNSKHTAEVWSVVLR